MTGKVDKERVTLVKVGESMTNGNGASTGEKYPVDVPFLRF